MKRFIGVALVAACACPSQANSEQSKLDTTRVNNLNEVVVKAVRAPKSSPFAVETIKKPELQQFAATGKELPLLFSRTPGVLAWSENGVGTGTTYMRMRGAGDSRINITVDGVPLNSPEDQCVFWANMNSYASLMGSAQIQRGIGSSTNGDGAFGGSISLQTAAPALKPTLEVTGSYGSFNTYRFGGNFSTGLLWNHVVLDGAYHETNTDGFVHGTSGRSGSYYGGLTWMSDRLKISYKNIGNFERTGQAWNGVAACNYDGDTSFREYGMNNYKDQYEYGLGKFNSLYEYVVFPETKDGKITTQRYKMRDGSYWDKTTDNFHQNHNILNFTWQPKDERWSHSLTAHYTYGYGYYDEFKQNTTLASKFGINETYVNSEGKTKNLKSDAVRQKGLTQNTYGALYNVNYKDALWDVTGGFNMQLFRCNHWGNVTYIADEAVEKKYLKGGKYKYYDSDAEKNDWSWFFKANRKFGKGWNWFLDVQMRYLNYQTDGINDRFITDADGKYVNHRIDIYKNYFFVNPKAGISYAANGHKAYASLAYANREPERNNFTNNGNYAAPSPERLLDLEWGYQYRGSNWFAGVNFYYMKYVNQFVMTGEKSDIGESLTRNIKDSYRLGAEISAGWSPLSWLSVEGNAALSRNKLKNFKERVESWDAEESGNYERWNTYKNSTIAFSPSAILNGFVDVHFGGFRATWHTNFVSKQYLDNTESAERSLPSYSQTDINASYTFNFAKRALGLKQIVLGADFNNIFDRHYAASGYVYYDWYYGGKRNSTVAYIPMAGFTCMGHITLKF